MAQVDFAPPATALAPVTMCNFRGALREPEKGKGIHSFLLFPFASPVGFWKTDRESAAESERQKSNPNVAY